MRRRRGCAAREARLTPIAPRASAPDTWWACRTVTGTKKKKKREGFFSSVAPLHRAGRLQKKSEYKSGSISRFTKSLFWLTGC